MDLMPVARFLKLPNLMRAIIGALLSLILLVVPANLFTTSEQAATYMLPGDETFSDTAGDTWTVGYAQAVLTPADVTADTYYIAGYNTNNPAQGVLDDMYAKAVYLDDNTGRGGVVLCAVDCVGLSRADINDIRKIVIESGEIDSLKSVNISATHAHSAIDTQGLWGKNFMSDGKNEAFMQTLKEKTAEAILAAYNARTDGKLYVAAAQTDDFQSDTREPVDYDNTLTRIRFAPADGSADTYIVNFAAHAEMLGSKSTLVSADFPAYMTEEIRTQANGANTVFINGAIGGLITADDFDDVLNNPDFDCIAYTKQYGKELGQFVLSMDNETEIRPLVNVKSVPVSVRCDNTALLLARIIGVLNNDMQRSADRKSVSILTEVSYMELGTKQIGIFMIPGELYPELESGNFLPADQAANGTDAEYKVLSEMSDCTYDFVWGLCNDELGYIIPDNDFLLHEWFEYFNIAYDEADRKHYEETNSVGPDTARSLLEAMDALIAGVQ